MQRAQKPYRRTLPFLLVLLTFLLLASHQPERMTPLTSAFAQEPATQDQDDVIRVSTELVVVNVTVLDKQGKFVPRLKRTDFHILEDGAEQKISSFTAEETPFAAAILLDTSGSM